MQNELANTIDSISRLCNIMEVNKQLFKSQKVTREILVTSLTTTIPYKVKSVNLISHIIEDDIIKICDMKLIVLFGLSLIDCLLYYSDSISISYLKSNDILYNFDIEKYL